MKSRWTNTGLVFMFALACGVAPARLHAQGQGKLQPPPPAEEKPDAPAVKPVKPPAGEQPKPKVVEEIAARVNNDVITTVELDHNKAQVVDDVKQECETKKCSPEEAQKMVEEGQRDALRGLIDTSLLTQRAKDLDISVETELIRELDQLRIDNKLETMEDLEKAVVAEGQDYEELKNNMRNQLLVHEVIDREVGERITGSIDRGQLQKYYEEHKDEFKTSEDGVRIREILLSTEGKPETEWPAIKAKAESYRDRITKGEDFGDMAKHFSNGSSAKDGGELGLFERGKLSKKIEDEVFKLNRNEMTPVMQASNGFLIIQVEERYEAGIQPFDKVETEVMGRMAQAKMAPKLREYLDTLRKDSFVEVRPGFVDTGAVAGDNSIVDAKTAAEAPSTVSKKPKKKKKLLIF
jgi:peptidyl-prolyl cis-trans isomerase SurA